MTNGNASSDPCNFSDILELAEEAHAGGGLTRVLEGETPIPPTRQAKEINVDLIHLTCSKCQRKMRVKSDRAGQRLKCPKC